MERLDFASVMAVLRRNIPDENFGNQTDFLHSLFLDVMLKYRCRILFTTRSRYENHISLEVGELNPDTLLELVGKFCPEAEKKQEEIKEIIDLLYGHTFAVELAARLLANGLLKPKALLTKLQKEKAALDTEDKIGTTKDGRNRKATYYDHIHSLFSLYKLSGYWARFTPARPILQQISMRI